MAHRPPLLFTSSLIDPSFQPHVSTPTRGVEKPKAETSPSRKPACHHPWPSSCIPLIQVGVDATPVTYTLIPFFLFSLYTTSLQSMVLVIRLSVQESSPDTSKLPRFSVPFMPSVIGAGPVTITLQVHTHVIQEKIITHHMNSFIKYHQINYQGIAPRWNQTQSDQVVDIDRIALSFNRRTLVFLSLLFFGGNTSTDNNGVDT